VTAGANWGASADERAMALPCDGLLPDARVRVHRAVSIDAPPPLVFRWLCQLKLAPYSYDVVDNLGRRSPRNLIPGSEHLEVGDRFMSIFSLSSFAVDEHLTLRSRRVALTYALLRGEGTGQTRLLARVLFDPPGGRLGSVPVAHLAALGDLVMMRKQLLTLKRLAERDSVGPG
jgi:hypothetical protein